MEMTEKEPKREFKPTGELGEAPLPEPPMDPKMKSELDDWTAAEQEKAKTPEEQVDVFVRRARTLVEAGYFDSAARSYDVANDRALASGLYQLSGEIMHEVMKMDTERRKRDNERRAKDKAA